MKLKRVTSFLFKLFSSLLILVLLFKTQDIDLASLADTVKKVDLFWFVLSLSGVILVLLIKSYRWKLLLKDGGIQYPAKDAAISYLSSYSVGVVSPGRIGEFVKVYNVRKDVNASFKDVFFATLTDRLYDMVFLFCFGMAALGKYFTDGIIHDLGYILVSVIFVLAGLFIFKYSYAIIRKRIKNTSNIIILVIDNCLLKLASNRSLIPWSITLFAYLVFFITVWFIFVSLQVPMGIIDTGFVISLVGIVLLLPISIAGFGTREATLILVLSQYGVGSEIAITFSLLQFTSFYLWGGIIGLIFWFIKPVSLKLISDDAKKTMKIIRSKNKQ